MITEFEPADLEAPGPKRVLCLLDVGTDEIIGAVARAYRFTAAELRGKDRHKSTAHLLARTP